MIAGQVLTTWWSLRGRSRRAAVPAGLLGVACLASLASGFFDGGLGHPGLEPGMAAYQAFLLVLTGVVGVLAAARAAQLAMLRPGHVARTSSSIATTHISKEKLP